MSKTSISSDKKALMETIALQCEKIYQRKQKWYGTLHDTIRERLVKKFNKCDIETGIKYWIENNQ